MNNSEINKTIHENTNTPDNADTHAIAIKENKFIAWLVLKIIAAIALIAVFVVGTKFSKEKDLFIVFAVACVIPFILLLISLIISIVRKIRNKQNRRALIYLVVDITLIVSGLFFGVVMSRVYSDTVHFCTNTMTSISSTVILVGSKTEDRDGDESRQELYNDFVNYVKETIESEGISDSPFFDENSLPEIVE